MEAPMTDTQTLAGKALGWACWNCGRVWQLTRTGVYTLTVRSDVICDCRLKGSRQVLHAIPQDWAQALAEA